MPAPPEVPMRRTSTANFPTGYMIEVTGHHIQSLLPSLTKNSLDWLNWTTSAPTTLNVWGDHVVFVPNLSGGTLYYHSISAVSSTAHVHSLSVGTSRRPPPLPHPSILRDAEHRGRRALRRSLDLFRRFRPEEELRTFLDGKPLVIHGHEYDYRVRKSTNLLRHTMNPTSPHIPYDLHIMDKQGNVLAKGCVVFPKTPVIDQLLALIFHVQDVQEEQRIIAITNWSPPLRRQRVDRMAA